MKAFVILVLTLLQLISSAEYYLKTGGTGADCTASSPCPSFDQVFQLKLQNRDIIYLNEGIYSGSQNTLRDFPLSISNLTIQKAPSAVNKPKIDLTGTYQFFTAPSRQTTNRFNLHFADLMFLGGNAPVGGVMDLQRDAGLFGFDRCDFRSNFASKGGAFHVGANNELILNECLFYDNAARGVGGAIAGEGAIIMMTSTNFTLNHAEEQGGSIFLGGESTIDGQNIFATSNMGSDGGFIYGNLNNVVTLNQTVITNSTANNDGGVFWGYQTIYDISNADIYKSVAKGKGGVARVFAQGSGLRCVDCTISDSSALVEGGAFDVQQQASLFLIDTTITGSSVVGVGGAIAVLTEARANLTRVTASNNIAKDGGFIRSYYRAKVWIIDGNIHDNHANLTGAAISCSDSMIYIFGETTFSDNTLTPGEKNATADPDFYCDDIPQGTKCRTQGDSDNKKWDNICPDPGSNGKKHNDYSELKTAAIVVAVLGVVCFLFCCVTLAVVRRYKRNDSPQGIQSEYSYNSLNHDDISHLDD